MPLETGAERSFAQLLSAAGIASIHFLPRVTQSDLTRLVRGFPTGRATAAALSEQLKTARVGVSGIRINEVRFIVEDASTADAKLSAQLVARTKGADADQFREWLNDPQKLLQLIAAAEGAKGGSRAGSGTSGGTSVGTGGGTGVHRGDAGAGLRAGGGSGTGAQSSEDELASIMRLLTRLGQLRESGGGAPERQQFEQQLSEIPERAQITLRQALASLAAQTPANQPDEPVLLKLAEHMAIRFALDRFERGEVA